ncbi:hypothetical protein AMJ47_00855 [Parcubacteria bacterium DG_72]|nr:MAG: hypothetical protein AMJ47_00855 [Parcubacteria bacterium DG_72]
MGLFDRKKSVSRQELRSALRRHSGRIKDSEGKYSSTERERLGKEVFGPKYGSKISKLDYQRAIRELENKKSRTKDIKERERIDDRIKYLEQLGGRSI